MTHLIEILEILQILGFVVTNNMAMDDEVQKDLELKELEVAVNYITQGKVNKNGILLRPQPSNDPNDPLVSWCSIA